MRSNCYTCACLEDIFQQNFIYVCAQMLKAENLHFILLSSMRFYVDNSVNLQQALHVILVLFNFSENMHRLSFSWMKLILQVPQDQRVDQGVRALIEYENLPSSETMPSLNMLTDHGPSLWNFLGFMNIQYFHSRSISMRKQIYLFLEI